MIESLLAVAEDSLIYLVLGGIVLELNCIHDFGVVAGRLVLRYKAHAIQFF